uniref:Uncharacterized protein n=1 Tax=Leptospirillum sp. Group II '5-way CG' TaxID=419541 RepID=B6ASD6_9BACT|nr:MAG: Hypothetical protein CGL2_10638006 [Leptospirillum sp. Group II '5-way CG']
MGENDLLKCLSDFPEITDRKYGKRYQLDQIENLVSHVGKIGKFTWEDFEKIRENDFLVL